MGLVNTEKANLAVEGIPLKTHCLIVHRTEGVFDCFGDGEWAKHEIDSIPEDRFDNPEIGDWCGYLALQVRVFDGKEWKVGELRLNNISDDQLAFLGPGSYVEYLMSLKYQYQL